MYMVILYGTGDGAAVFTVAAKKEALEAKTKQCNNK